MCSLHRYTTVYVCMHALIMLEILVYAQIIVPAPELDAMR